MCPLRHLNTQFLLGERTHYVATSLHECADLFTSSPIIVIIHAIFVISVRTNVTRVSSSCHIFSIPGAVDLNT